MSVHNMTRNKGKTLRIEHLERRQMLSGAPPVVFTASGGADFTLWQDYVNYGLPSGTSEGWDKEQISFYTHNWGVARASGTIAGANATVMVSAEDQNVSVHWSDKGTESFITLNVYVRDDFNQAVPFVIDASESFSVYNSGNDSVRWAGASGSHGADGSTTRQFSGSATGVATFNGVQYRLARTINYYAGVITAFGVPASGQAGAASGTSSISAYINRGEKPLVELKGQSEVRVGSTSLILANAYDPDNAPSSSGINGKGIINYSWTASEGVVLSNASGTFTRAQFTTPGQHRISVVVTDDEGQTASTDHYVNVLPLGISFVGIDDTNPDAPIVTVRVDGDATDVTWKLVGDSVRFGIADEIPGTGDLYTFTVSSVSLLPIAQNYSLEVTAVAYGGKSQTTENAELSISALQRKVYTSSTISPIVIEGVPLTSWYRQSRLTTNYTNLEWTIPGQRFDSVIRSFQWTVISKIPEDETLQSNASARVTLKSGTNSDNTTVGVSSKIDSIGNNVFFSGTYRSGPVQVFAKRGQTLLEFEMGGGTRALEGLAVWVPSSWTYMF